MSLQAGVYAVYKTILGYLGGQARNKCDPGCGLISLGFWDNAYQCWKKQRDWSQFYFPDSQMAGFRAPSFLEDDEGNSCPGR